VSTFRAIHLAGPTAAGKSAVALTLAERIGGEIVSVDSIQVYRGLDIGSAKPTKEEQKKAPHHLIDIRELEESFDAAQFVELAGAAIGEIAARGRTPILCGGTGLYFKALFGGLGDSPTPDPALRAELEATPLEELSEELERRDPSAYARIDRQNPRRVVRAVEVIRLTGKPFSEQRADWRAKSQPDLWVLRRESEDLRARVDQRVDAMFERGLLDETAALLGKGLRDNQTAMQAIGYRQVVEHLEGVRSLDDTIELIKSKTRQFARRQMTWFRNQMSPRWIDVAPDDTGDAIADRLLKERTI